MFKNAKIRTKIMLGFGIILLFMLITTICSYYSLNHVESVENGIVNKLIPMSNDIKSINIEIIDEESGVRGYIASSGNEKYLDSYDSGRKTINEKIKDLKKYYNSYAEIGSVIENEEVPNIEVVNKHFDSQIELVKNGSIQTALDRLNDGKGYMDAFKHVQDKVNNQINYNLAEALKNSQAAQSSSKVLLLAIFLISFIISIIISIFYSYKMAGQLRNSVSSLQKIAEGNLSDEPIKVDSRDEFGQLGSTINLMQRSLKQLIAAITSNIHNVSESVAISDKNVHDLSAKLEGISATVEQLSAGVQETAASSEEINASSSELKTAVQSIADKAQEGEMSAEKIREKAAALKENSVMLEEDANRTRISIKNVMDEALEKVKEVEKIKTLADTIQEISSQTNLLALNASIEAARAGEQGRGFTVVAEEIRKLAESTSETVNKIQSTIQDVFAAVESLTSASKGTLDYIETKVVKSYRESVAVGESYDKDAEYVHVLVTDLSATTEELLASAEAVAEAIEEISSSNTEAAHGTNDIAEEVLKIKDRAKDVKNQTSHVDESMNSLKELVLKFKL